MKIPPPDAPQEPFQDGGLETAQNAKQNATQDATQEPWLTHLSAPLAARHEASSVDFAARVMQAPASQAHEPWLEWLAVGRDQTDTPSPEASVFESAVFARRVGHAFAAEQTQSRTTQSRIKEWAWRSAGGLAACLALVVAFWPTAKPPAPHRLTPTQASATTLAPPPLAGTLALAIKQQAEGWLAQQTRQVAATLGSTKQQATSVLTQYATPIKVSCYLLGLNLPPTPPQAAGEADSSATEQPRSSLRLSSPSYAQCPPRTLRHHPA